MPQNNENGEMHRTPRISRSLDAGYPTLLPTFRSARVFIISSFYLLTMSGVWGRLTSGRSSFMRHNFTLLGLVIVLAGRCSVADADDWPGFRGSKNGVAPDQDLPAQLTPDNILWKVK